MRCEVVMTLGAEQDLEEICDYIAEHDAPAKAEHVLAQVDKVMAALAVSPARGSYPRELLQLGIREFRQTLFKPYRVVYRVIEQTVFVLLIADARRDLQRVLEQRLLRS
jgi:toxin ParE1/3/4